MNTVKPRQKLSVFVGQKGRDEIYLDLDLDSVDQTIVSQHLYGVGDRALLLLMDKWRPLITGHLQDIPVPEGRDRASMLLRELILKAQGGWNYPYQDKELCHCRAVPTEVVDRAILAGATTPEKVSRWTSASTACGTCRQDVISLLKFRYGNPS